MLFRQAVFFSALCVVIAQNFSVPSGWRKPTANLSGKGQANISQALIDTIVPLFNASSGYIDVLGHTQMANLLCAIALHDLISGNKSNEAAVTDHLITVGQIHPGYYDTLNWALAAIYAYRAYGELYLLDIASSLWKQTNQYMITPANAASGNHPLRNSSFPGECNGATAAGGVFYDVDSRSTDVNGATIGGFMTLSAHLFEATNDTRYATAAELSAEFIRSHLYNGTIVLDTITLANCTISDAAVTYNSGFYIEGLSIWANVTNDSTWMNFLNRLISTAIPFPTWTGTDGINTEGPISPNDALTDEFGQALKAIFIRGLYEAWSRSGVDSTVAKLIQSYILVQYNALLDLASFPGRNQYSPRWHGPPVDHLLPWGQLAALDVLNSAVGLAPLPSSNARLAVFETDLAFSDGFTTATTSIVPSSTATGSSSATRRKRDGLIAGITIGGVFFLIIAFIIGLLLRRRSERADSNPPPNPQLSHSPQPTQQKTSHDMSRAPQSSPPPSQTSYNLLALGAPDRLRGSGGGGLSTTPVGSPQPAFNLSLVKHDPSVSQAGDPPTALTVLAAPQSAQHTIGREQLEVEDNATDTDDPAMLPHLIRQMSKMIATIDRGQMGAKDIATYPDALGAHDRLQSSSGLLAIPIDPSPPTLDLPEPIHNMNILQAGSLSTPSMQSDFVCLPRELQNLEHIPTALRPAAQEARAILPTAPLQSEQTNTIDRGQTVSDDPAMLPHLILQMNRMLARLPDRKMLDLVFIQDCTGSQDEYIKSATGNIRPICQDIVESGKLQAPEDLRIGLIAYRDHPPQDCTYITKNFGFSSDVGQVERNLSSLYASGGGDGPEAVTAALAEVLNMNWRPQAGKMVVLIADAPPHGIGEYGDGFDEGSPDGNDPLQIARIMASRGIVLFFVACERTLSRYSYATDFYQALTNITSGLMLPLTTADLLSHVIVGSVLEDLDMERLVREVGQAVSQRTTGNNERVDDVARELHERLLLRNESAKKVAIESIYRESEEAKHNVSVYMNASSLAEAGPQLKKVSGTRFTDKYRIDMYAC